MGGLWADLGSGGGAFTLALAELIGPEGAILSVDKDRRALAEQQKRMQSRFPSVQVHYIEADFSRPLDLPKLDGIVMANSLHFHRRKAPIVASVRDLLGPTGRLVLVEYNVDHGNPWVPYPVAYATWEALALRCGFSSTRLIGKRPSSFLREIYSAVSLRAAPGEMG